MKPLNKTFVLTQFGTPHEWTNQFIENVQHLAEFGWYWKVFTPNDIQSKGNFEVIPMTIEEFNKKTKKATGVNPEVTIQDGLPSKPMSDYYVATGVIFQEYLKDVDYWGITNWDVVYGRLDHFIPDEELSKFDIWSDDVNTINGVFSLYKNTPDINLLFMMIRNWKLAFKSEKVYGTDEYGLTEVLRVATKPKFGYPANYPMLSHDRLEQHVPTPKLEIKEDGSLWELFKDVKGPEWIHARPFIGKEIPYFHFNKSKRWPL